MWDRIDGVDEAFERGTHRVAHGGRRPTGELRVDEPGLRGGPLRVHGLERKRRHEVRRLAALERAIDVGARGGHLGLPGLSLVKWIVGKPPAFPRPDARARLHVMVRKVVVGDVRVPAERVYGQEQHPDEVVGHDEPRERRGAEPPHARGHGVAPSGQATEGRGNRRRAHRRGEAEGQGRRRDEDHRKKKPLLLVGEGARDEHVRERRPGHGMLRPARPREAEGEHEDEDHRREDVRRQEIEVSGERVGPEARRRHAVDQVDPQVFPRREAPRSVPPPVDDQPQPDRPRHASREAQRAARSEPPERQEPRDEGRHEHAGLEAALEREPEERARHDGHARGEHRAVATGHGRRERRQHRAEAEREERARYVLRRRPHRQIRQEPEPRRGPKLDPPHVRVRRPGERRPHHRREGEPRQKPRGEPEEEREREGVSDAHGPRGLRNHEIGCRLHPGAHPRAELPRELRVRRRAELDPERLEHLEVLVGMEIRDAEERGDRHHRELDPKRRPHRAFGRHRRFTLRGRGHAWSRPQSSSPSPSRNSPAAPAAPRPSAFATCKSSSRLSAMPRVCISSAPIRSSGENALAVFSIESFSGS